MAPSFRWLDTDVATLVREPSLRDHDAVVRADPRLALEVKPERPVIWSPNWDKHRATVARDPEHLAELIATLANNGFGGIQRSGSTGPWSQVMYFGDGEYMVELHPMQYDLEPGPMYFERVVPVSAAEAGRVGWAWVRGEQLPDHDIEFRVVPPGDIYDVEM